MSNTYGESSVLQTAAVAIPTTVETVVATSNALSPPVDSFLAMIQGWLQLTSGTGTTGVTLRVRRGTDITGVLVGVATVQTDPGGAGATSDYSIQVQERPGAGGSFVYVLTVQQTAAAANGSVLQASIAVTMMAG